jgi:Flp pilus assembly protein TadB
VLYTTYNIAVEPKMTADRRWRDVNTTLFMAAAAVLVAFATHAFPYTPRARIAPLVGAALGLLLLRWLRHREVRRERQLGRERRQADGRAQ